MDFALRCRLSWGYRHSEIDFHRCRRALRGAVEYGLDIVAVGILDKGRIIVRVIGTHTRCPQILAPGLDCGSMEALDSLAVTGLERQVNPAGQLAQRRGTVRAGNAQFIEPEEAGTFTAHGDVQHRESRLIESFTRVQVADYQLDMIDKAAP